jgi:hypothetical protein
VQSPSKSPVWFLLASRTIYEVVSATYTAKNLPDGAACADVQGALPM